MGNIDIIRKVDHFAKERGLVKDQNYTWSYQGPVFIYFGTNDPHRGLTIKDVLEIRKAGAKFEVK